MLPLRTFPLLLLVGILASVSALKCNEGFNASISGVPLYHWVENTCAANSECFGQELTVKVNQLQIVMRYGGCVSSAYSSYLTCENLFGKDSTFDPAKLLDLIPDLDQKFKVLVESFANDTLRQVELLFSSGQGVEEFVAGIVKFMENFGFNMEKAKEIEPEVAALFKSLFNITDNGATASANLLAAIGRLDTDNSAISANIYKFLGNFMSADDINRVKNEPYAVLIEKIPGLAKSILPADWEANTWYDALFKMLGEIQFQNPKQSVADVINTIKTTADIPDDVSKYLDPIFNSLPELVSQLVAGNVSYAATWPVELLKKYSVTNTATSNLKTAIYDFIGGLGVAAIPPDVKTLIEWLPGFFYQFFPASETEISDVYKKIADGLNSFDTSTMTTTAEETKMSKFILFMLGKTLPEPLPAPGPDLIINFSKMFYNLLSDYTDKLDIFFDTLTEGFKNYPQFDAGKIITQLVTNLDGTVPPEVEPLLTNLQDVINGFTAVPFDSTTAFNALSQMVTAYKNKFPNSDLPDVVQEYIDIVKKIAEGKATQEEIQEMNINLQIDFYFAIFKAMDISSDQMFQSLLEAFPSFRTYIELIEALDPADVKDLFRDFNKWLVDGITNGQLTAESFAETMKPTVEKITKKLTSVLQDLRYFFAPNSCKFGTCDADKCNTHEKIESEKAVTKATTTTTTKEVTNGSPSIGCSPILINVATMAMAWKHLLQ